MCVLCYTGSTATPLDNCPRRRPPPGGKPACLATERQKDSGTSRWVRPPGRMTAESCGRPAQRYRGMLDGQHTPCAACAAACGPGAWHRRHAPQFGSRWPLSSTAGTRSSHAWTMARHCLAGERCASLPSRMLCTTCTASSLISLRRRSTAVGGAGPPCAGGGLTSISWRMMSIEYSSAPGRTASVRPPSPPPLDPPLAAPAPFTGSGARQPSCKILHPQHPALTT